jgi:hypothetical protein
MTVGDLVFVTCRQRGTATFSVGVTGGQTWNTLTRGTQSTTTAVQSFWARYNGTWDADPRFDFSAGTNTSAQMMVFRPSDTAKLWAIDTAHSISTFAAAATITITGHTRTNSSCVTIASWHTADDNTWGTLSGTGWAKTNLSAQYRNTSGSDGSCTFAYNIGSGATNNVSQTQLTLGNDAGVYQIVSFYEYDAPAAQTATPSLKVSGIAFYATTLQARRTFDVPLKASGATFYTQSIAAGDISLTAGFVPSAFQAFTPQLGIPAKTLTAGLVASGFQAFTPTLDANRAFDAPQKASGLQFFSPSVAARSHVSLNFFDRSPTLYPVSFGEETTTPTSTIFTPVRLNAVGLEKVSLVI